MFRVRISDFIGYAILLIINLSIIYFYLGLNKIDINLPLGYSSDFLLNITWIKQIITGEFPFYDSPKSIFLGAPFLHESYDFLNPIFSNLIFIKFLSLFSSDHFVVFNLYLISTFILNPLSMYFVLRRLRINIYIALTVATLFNFIPFHFFRFFHTLYTGYFFIPLLTYILLLLLNKKPLFFKYSLEKEKYIFDYSKKNIFFILVLVFASTWNFYYTFFFLVILSSVFIFYFINKKNKYFIYSGVIIVSLSIIPFLINTIPFKIHTLTNGVNSEVAKRGISESEVFGLKIAPLLLPATNHNIDKLAKITDTYTKNAHLVNENHVSTTLGFFGSIGFMALIFGFFIHNKYLSVIKRLTYFNITAILFSTIGGFSALFSLLITPSLRGHNRISMYIATFAFISFAIILNHLTKKYKMKKILILIISIFILFIGLYDQLAKNSSFSLSQDEKKLFISDKKFINEIKNLHIDTKYEAKVMQYPYMSYPESPPIVNMTDYSQIIGYLHSSNIKWSYGTVRGREGDTWRKKLDKLDINRQVDILAMAGFTGIYIDRRGYVDNGADLENRLSILLGKKPLVSDDNLKSFFKLTPISNDAYAPELYPIILKGFYGWEGAENSHGWSSGNVELKLFDSKKPKDKLELSFMLNTLQKREIEIFYGKELIKKLEVIPGNVTKVDLYIDLKDNENILYFKTDNNITIPGNGDLRKLSFTIDNLKYKFIGSDELCLLFTKGFYGWEGVENSHGWANGNVELKLFDSKKPKDKLELSFMLNTLQKREIEIFYGKELIKKVEIIPGNVTKVNLNIDLKDNENMLYFKTDNNVTVPGNNDLRKLSFAIDNLKYK